MFFWFREFVFGRWGCNALNDTWAQLEPAASSWRWLLGDVRTFHKCWAWVLLAVCLWKNCTWLLFWSNDFPSLAGTTRYQNYRGSYYNVKLCVPQENSIGHRPSCTVLVIVICCFSGPSAAWFVMYQANSHCMSLPYCTREVASLYIHQLSLWNCQSLHSALWLGSPKSWDSFGHGEILAQAPLFRNCTPTSEDEVVGYVQILV